MDNGKIAFVFPGQGAQFPRMGKELYSSSSGAKKIFDAAEDLRKGTIAQCFDSTKEELSLTVNTQPCIFTVSLAFCESLKEQGVKAQAAAGFSAGELAALTYAEVFSFEDGFKTVCKRAELMQRSAEESEGSMAAVLRLSEEKVISLCNEHGVYAVNFNCPGQIVVSGKKEDMPAFCDSVAKEGGRALPLAVNGAFHSPLMSKAYNEFKEYLKDVKMSEPKIPVYANLTALPYKENDMLETLSLQMKSPVLWQRTVENMLKDGITQFIEAEPGKVLTGLIAKIKV